MRQPGIEPGSNGWEPSMITTTPQALGLKHVFNLNPQKRHQEDSNFRGRIPSRFLIYRLNHSAMVPKLGGPTGIWTRIAGFRVRSANQLHHKTWSAKMPPPGIEPGTFRSSVWRSPNWAKAASVNTSSGDRTHDHKIKSLALYLTELSRMYYSLATTRLSIRRWNSASIL